MKHFGITAWSDYVRGTLADGTRNEMMRHLDSGCSRCASMAATLGSVRDDAQFESEHQPPDWAVRSVQAFFSVQQPARTARFSLLQPRLAFDSAMAPVGVGVRSLQPDSRQMVYYAQELAVSLQVQYEGPERRLQLDGELLHRNDGALESVPALLLRGNEVVGRAVSGELGEFQLSSDPGRPSAGQGEREN